MSKEQHTMTIEHIENYDLALKGANDYASSGADNLRQHLKTNKRENSNKCNQCDYASSQAGHLRQHLKTHTGEKSNKCNQCDYESSQAGHLRRHLKKHSGEK